MAKVKLLQHGWTVVPAVICLSYDLDEALIGLAEKLEFGGKPITDIKNLHRVMWHPRRFHQNQS